MHRIGATSATLIRAERTFDPRSVNLLNLMVDNPPLDLVELDEKHVERMVAFLYGPTRRSHKQL